MSRNEILAKIEHLRAELNKLSADSTDYTRLLGVSQVLDRLIAEYYRTAV